MVEARHITMDFRIDQNRTTNLKEFVVDALRRQTHATTFRALDDVSFIAEKGSVLYKNLNAKLYLLKNRKK